MIESQQTNAIIISGSNFNKLNLSSDVANFKYEFGNLAKEDEELISSEVFLFRLKIMKLFTVRKEKENFAIYTGG